MSYTGLEPIVILATIFYALLGVLLMFVSVVLFHKVFHLSIKKELIEDENQSVGILIAGMAIAIAIIIASAIH